MCLCRKFGREGVGWGREGGRASKRVRERDQEAWENRGDSTRRHREGKEKLKKKPKEGSE